ncbi:unnamed protein product [Vicia faba]|uniref:Uncharacterized protein n=1 Tax=Vicia faba TaxID=3906 RepID=A0AAV1A7A1_VICFA|nr:unnamed protein product [Vicia faba]
MLVPTPIRKIIDHAKTTLEEPHVEPHVESYDDPHVEPNVKIYIPTSGEPGVEPPTESVVDILVFDTNVNDILDEDDDLSEHLRDNIPQLKNLRGNSSPVTKSTRKDVLLELMEVSKAMQETLNASTIRKRNVDRLIKMWTKEKYIEEEEEFDSEEEEKLASEEKEKSPED